MTESREPAVPPTAPVAPASGVAPEVVLDAQLPPPGSDAPPNFFADPGVLACKCYSCTFIVFIGIVVILLAFY